MEKKILCATHGEREAAFVCSHLLGACVGLGFNRDTPTLDQPFPDAWCDECEKIRVAHNGWNEESEKLARISLLCSGCYEQACIRNTRTAVTLGDLANLRWKCGSCDEWHTGPCLDFGYDSPCYWSNEHEKSSRFAPLLARWSMKHHKTFLNDDFCAINDEHFFVRGLIQIPIIGTAEKFCWGVWGSLSRENFKTLLINDKNPKRSELPPMFSWLSSQIDEYPDTRSLKMHAHIRNPRLRPVFELELTSHPLSQEFHIGISAEKVKEIMLRRLPANYSA
jgi:hypothetical protein